MLGKKTFTLILSLILLVSGAYLTYTYSSPVKEKDVLAQGTTTVPANSYRSIEYVQNSAGNYYVQVNATKGTIQTFLNAGSSFGNNGTILNIQKIPASIVLNNSSGGFNYQTSEGKGIPVYLFFLNPDSFSKTVSYSVTCDWTYNNYFASIAGIALISLGTILLFLTLFKNKLRDFNKALENPQ
jgi:hypothetical protein